jgi:hypothetical protein
LFIVFCLSLNGCVVGNLAMWIQVKRYSEDGIIYDSASSVPILGAVFSLPGYRIEFPKFLPDRAYGASYRLSNVPQRGGHPATVYLRFGPKPDWIRALYKQKSVTAVFRIILEDNQRRILHSAELPVATSGWTDAGGPFGVYELQKSEFFFEAHKSYILRVSYIPGEVPPPADELHFSIENQGSK